MNPEFLAELEEDVRDCKKQVADAAKEIEEAQQWHEKMVINYAKAIIAVTDYMQSHKE